MSTKVLDPTLADPTAVAKVYAQATSGGSAANSSSSSAGSTSSASSANGASSLSSATSSLPTPVQTAFMEEIKPTRQDAGYGIGFTVRALRDITNANGFHDGIVERAQAIFVQTLLFIIPTALIVVSGGLAAPVFIPFLIEWKAQGDHLTAVESWDKINEFYASKSQSQVMEARREEQAAKDDAVRPLQKTIKRLKEGDIGTLTAQVVALRAKIDELVAVKAANENTQKENAAEIGDLTSKFKTLEQRHQQYTVCSDKQRNSDAQTITNLKDELKHSEQVLTGYRANAKEDLENAKREVAQLIAGKKAVEDQVTTLLALGQEGQAAKQRASQLSEQVSNLSRDLNTANASLQGLQQRFDQATNAQKELEKANNALLATHQRLQDSYTAMKGELAGHKENVASLKSELEQAKAAREEAVREGNAEARALFEQKTKIESELNTAQQASSLLGSQNISLKETLNQLTTDYTEVSARIMSLKKEHQVTLDSKNAEIKQLTTELRARTERATELEKQLSTQHALITPGNAVNLSSSQATPSRPLPPPLPPLPPALLPAAEPSFNKLVDMLTEKAAKLELSVTASSVASSLSSTAAAFVPLNSSSASSSSAAPAYVPYNPPTPSQQRRALHVETNSSVTSTVVPALTALRDLNASPLSPTASESSPLPPPRSPLQRQPTDAVEAGGARSPNTATPPSAEADPDEVSSSAKREQLLEPVTV